MTTPNQALVFAYLTEQDLSTEKYNKHGAHGILFGIVFEMQLLLASMDHDGEIVLTTCDLNDGRTRKERWALMDAVNEGVVTGLQDLCHAITTDPLIMDNGILGDLGKQWAKNHQDLTDAARLRMHDGLRLFPELVLHRRLEHFTDPQAAD